MARTWKALAAGLLCLVGTAGLQAQEFTYGFDGVPADGILGPGGSTHDVEIGLTITSAGIADGDPGPQGWSLGVRNSNMDIQSVTTDGTVAADVSAGGLRNTGFEVFEIVNPDLVPASGPLANGPQGQGAVQAIVLSFVMNITLPANETAVVGKISYTCTIPAADCVTAGVEFANGLQGAGQPVSNDITQQGQTVSPSLSSASFDCCVPPEGPTDLLLGTADDHAAQSVDLLIGGDNTVAITAYIGPGDEDSLPTGGAQGWSLGVEHDAASLELVEATTLGTTAADVNDDPPGVRNTGFEVTEIIDPARQDPVGREGLVSAVVLSFVMPITLAPDVNNSVLVATYRADEGAVAETSTQIDFADGLVGSGQPVQTVLTIDGQTVEPATKHSVSVNLVDVPPAVMRDQERRLGSLEPSSAATGPALAPAPARARGCAR